MSHGKLRSDNECENCGYTVEVAYCTKCGQHNVETRQTFPKLVGHFAEDLTHYDTAFWRSLKHLLFRPGRLTRIYLEGKRQQYVPPVKLYIFISFITFLLIAVLPDVSETKKADDKIADYKKVTISTTEFDNVNGKIVQRPVKKEIKESNIIALGEREYTTQAELDKDYQSGEIGFILYHMGSAMMHAKDKTTQELGEALMHALPKAIFLYMPIFTFWIWLLHGKKRWYFFDHGIFTLHYFSFLLLITLIDNVFSFVLELTLDDTIAESISGGFSFLILCYSFFYFFRSHRRMYGESKTISRLKSLFLFVINMISLTAGLLLLVYFTFKNMH